MHVRVRVRACLLFCIPLAHIGSSAPFLTAGRSSSGIPLPCVPISTPSNICGSRRGLLPATMLKDPRKEKHRGLQLKES